VRVGTGIICRSVEEENGPVRDNGIGFVALWESPPKTFDAKSGTPSGFRVSKFGSGNVTCRLLAWGPLRMDCDGEM